jgi:hypothetical protein
VPPAPVTTSSGGGGGIISGPLAFGYVNTNPQPGTGLAAAAGSAPFTPPPSVPVQTSPLSDDSPSFSLADGGAIAQNAPPPTGTDTSADTNPATSSVIGETATVAAQGSTQTAAVADAEFLPGPWWVWMLLLVILLIISGAWVYRNSAENR